MIIVSGTQRSGTSLWMQVLGAGGFSRIGAAFPGPTDPFLVQANPRGFFESRLVGGVNFQSNPDPETGEYLFPEHTRAHAVKIFIPGLLRTDVAFIDRVIATMRPWREFCRSLTRLRRLAGQEAVAREMSPHPALTWWTENYSLIRDLATRRYAIHVLSYASLLRDPQAVVDEVFEWIGVDGVDARAAAAAVDPGLRSQDASAIDELHEGLGEAVEVFDELYARVDEGMPLDAAFVERLNLTDVALRPLVLEHQARLHGAMVRELAGAE